MKQSYLRQKQRLILINRDFQLRYSGAAVFVGLASTVLTTSIILYPLFTFEILRIPRFLPLPILGVMAMAAVLNMGLVGFMGVLLTHRMAGPMYSLVRQFRRIESGYWHGHMKIRDGDEMQYVVRNFNAMIDSIQKQVQQDVERIRDAQKILTDSNLSNSERIAETMKSLSSLEEKLQERLENNPQSEA